MAMVPMVRFTVVAALLCLGLPAALHTAEAAAPAARGEMGTASPPKTIAISQGDFVGDYSDPNHPGCKRRVEADGTVSGTDGSPGCEHGEEQTPWSLQGVISGDTITVDFSPKGGPKGLVGIWTGDGILWADGNTWTKLTGGYSRL